MQLSLSLLLHPIEHVLFQLAHFIVRGVLVSLELIRSLFSFLDFLGQLVFQESHLGRGYCVAVSTGRLVLIKRRH